MPEQRDIIFIEVNVYAGLNPDPGRKLVLSLCRYDSEITTPIHTPHSSSIVPLVNCITMMMDRVSRKYGIFGWLNGDTLFYSFGMYTDHPDFSLKNLIYSFIKK